MINLKGDKPKVCPFLEPLVTDHSECPMKMQNGQNAPNIVELLRYILQTPEDLKGFVKFSVQVEGLNVTGYRPGHGPIVTCELFITNPLASYTIQVI